MSVSPLRGPSPALALVGRDALVAEVGAALAAPGAAVVLVGPAGVGKSAVAGAVAGRYVGEVRRIELAGATEAAEVAARTARVLGVDAPDPRAEDPGGAIAAALSDDRAGLLVADTVDRCGAAGVEVLVQIARARPGMRVLVTSRARLDELGVPHVPVAPLAPAEAAELFVAFARRSRPGFALDAEAEAGVRALCEALDGLPLAIELAAARVGLLGPKQLHERLDERFRLLVRAPRGAEDRHASLHAALAWSWEPLPAYARAALAQLTVFRGGFSVEAAEAVLDLGAFPDAPLAVLVLEELLARALLVVTVPPEAPDGPRLGFLQTVHAFAAAHLDAGAAMRAERRHAEWVATLPKAEPTRVPSELRNRLAAVERIAERRWADLYVPVVVERLLLAGPQLPGEALLPVHARMLADAEVPAEVRAECLRHWGWVHAQQGGPAESREASFQALEARSGDGDLHPDALWQCMNTTVLTGAYALARRVEAALAAGDRRRGVQEVPANRLVLQRSLRLAVGDLPAAEALFLAGEARLAEMSPGTAVIHASNWVEPLALELGRPAEALALAERAARRAAEVGLRPTEAIALARCALALRALGRLDEAVAAAERGVRVATEAGSARARGIVLVQLLESLLRRDGPTDEVRALADRLEASQDHLHGVPSVVETAAALARAFHRAGERARAEAACARMAAAVAAAAESATAVDRRTVAEIRAELDGGEGRDSGL